MSIIKLNNRSVKDITSFGSISSLGSLTHIATQTASSSASLSFTSGIDSTYKEYIFYFVNIHPATDQADFSFNFSVDTGSNYNVTKTSTFFKSQHQGSSGNYGSLDYFANGDLAQSTNFQELTEALDNGNTSSVSGSLTIFNPSSTTFVKHYLYKDSEFGNDDFAVNSFVAGYGNTTSAVDAIQFKMSSGNIDSGQILLFGLN